MDGLVLALVVVNGMVFLALATVAVVRARRERSMRVRLVLAALAAAAAAFTLSAAFRLGLLAVKRGWAASDVEDLLVSWWAVAQLVAGLAFGVAAWLVVSRAVGDLSRADRLARALGDRFRPEVEVEGLGLTARELEVFHAIGRGVISDRELAEELFISPATAATHVKHILRKAGLNDRRDLLVLGAASEQRSLGESGEVVR